MGRNTPGCYPGTGYFKHASDNSRTIHSFPHPLTLPKQSPQPRMFIQYEQASG
ncbi:hypothetical protein [Peribacillus phoenicis]|uniref:hypothetical protein n=1 Tax=Peribacillus sp. 1P06PA-2 TaxID=3132295 RepID=UPI0039A723AC